MTRANKLYNTTGRITVSFGLLGVIALLGLTISAAVQIMMLASIINSIMIILIYFTMLTVIGVSLFFIYRIINSIHDILTGINKTK